MQLKGLVRFFTILLILYSVWQLSYTLFVRKHEKKMKAIAERYVNSSFPLPAEKYPGDAAMQAVYQDTLDEIKKQRLNQLLDSTRETKITWFGETYQKARSEELNLGLDLQGGMNVTLEVELVDLLRSLSNNSREPNFLKALENANKRKANSNADFITLFIDEYKTLGGGSLAALFSVANPDKIKITDPDSKVESVIRTEAEEAIERTYNILSQRIDQFGVAQPNVNLEKERGIITVELPGVDNESRVRKLLQATSNLQFWETYKAEELQNAITGANQAFNNYVLGKTTTTDTATQAKSDTSANQNAQPRSLAEILNSNQSDTASQTASVATPQSSKVLFGLPGESWIFQSTGSSGGIGYVMISDTARVRDYLMLDVVRTKFPPDAKFLYGVPERLDNQKLDNKVPLHVIRTNGRDVAPLEGDAITDARQDFNPLDGKPVVSMSMNSHGEDIWERLTDMSYKNTRPIAIVLDDIVYSAPIAYKGKIEGGNTEISGSFTIDEASDLATILKLGKLPAAAKIVQEQVVGPTLGAEAIRGGINAFFISFIVIFLLMLVYYNTSGWIANIALILNLLFTVGVLTGLGATLTAPGIAGLVLTIGMAVDTNVVIYERIKEELTRGKNYLQAINDGYRRSLPPVLDGHITTLLTAIILFYFGLGPVKGFATTQILGLLLSLFCGILVSRWVTDWFTSKKRHLEYFTGISRRIFKHAKFKFIEYRRVAYGISVVVLCLGIGAFINGFDEGVEFSGGRSYVVRFQKPVNNDIEKIREDLKVTFAGENPVIKTIGANNQLDITTSYLIDSTGEQVDSIVRDRLMTGLKKYNAEKILGSKKVLPTISDDLKKGAMWATFWSLLVITIYIFIRFRDWRYSLGTIAALLHDVLVTLAVFSFCKNIVPFPLEIDQHFIAAILTVIGFSMNDTVIIFDRIREYSRELKGAPKETIINRAINDTLSRTIMTSLTVFIVILILFLLGGEVTRGFAFAMLVGIITGIYSSVYVAAPVLVDLARKRPLGEADLTADKKTKPETKKPATA